MTCEIRVASISFIYRYSDLIIRYSVPKGGGFAPFLALTNTPKSFQGAAAFWGASLEEDVDLPARKGHSTGSLNVDIISVC